MCESECSPNAADTGKLCHSEQQWHDVQLDATMSSVRVARGGGADLVHCGN